MAIFKNLSNNLFGWISPRETHERNAKSSKSHDLKSPAVTAAVRRKTQISIAAAKQITEGPTHVATGNVPFRRKGRNSGSIPWEDAPPSSPLADTIENQLASTALHDGDAEMEDAGEEGAVDTMSEEDESTFIDDEVSEGLEAEEDDEERKEASEVGDDRKVETTAEGESEQATEPDEVRSETSQDDADDEADIRDANEGTNVVDLAEDQEAALEAATRQLEIDRQAKFEEQKEAYIELEREGWHPNTIDLYLLVDRRTVEPLLPADWKMDFPLFPWHVFTWDYKEAFLGGTRPENDFIMNKALQNLCKLPVHMRNQIRINAWYGRRAEAMVVKYCEDYMKFIHKDCKLWIPIKKKKLWSLICYAPGDPEKSADELEELALKRLRKRKEKVLDLLRVADTSRRDSDFFWHDGSAYLVEPPTLYGVVAKQTVVALVAYEPLSPRDALRTIAFFHMSKPKYDVWNALALAIVMIHCRDHLLKIKKAIPENLDDLKLTDDEEDL
ncbi:uncharacterized protein PV09_06685 [Verruconis gallopava]|uniref:Uncharacterized protein n=1 Tax=Verruconis gallopava TaxID=253628 RepID=A0A0D2ARK7_9PEZI|nr:uncharacterized protein PV09_06685 [Verruconis gallopava]KIW01834.1 hypothetical protein PV09_06685 [Verruconis gallopava]